VTTTESISASVPDVIVLDVNPTHGIALVADRSGGLYANARHVPLTDENRRQYDERDSHEGSAFYIRQAHYVAATAIQGLVVMDRGTPRDGWVRPDAQPTSWLSRGHRRA
jgi:hypothetical protein